MTLGYIDFSVFMAVRGNIPGLRIALGAFELFTANKDRFEVILIADDDDPDCSIYEYLFEDYTFDIFVFKVKRSDEFNRDYYNAHVEHTRGTHIMVWNDDCYMQTNAWDDKVRDAVKAKDRFNGVYLVDLMDSTRTHMRSKVAFPRFPMISRKAVDAAGFFFFDKPRNWPADKVIWDLYTQVGCVVPCHEVKIQHDHNFDHEGDPTKSRFLRILMEDRANGVFPVDGIMASRKLVEAIRVCSDKQ